MSVKVHCTQRTWLTPKQSTGSWHLSKCSLIGGFSVEPCVLWGALWAGAPEAAGVAVKEVVCRRGDVRHHQPERDLEGKRNAETFWITVPLESMMQCGLYLLSKRSGKIVIIISDLHWNLIYWSGLKMKKEHIWEPQRGPSHRQMICEHTCICRERDREESGSTCFAVLNVTTP